MKNVRLDTFGVIRLCCRIILHFLIARIYEINSI